MKKIKYLIVLFISFITCIISVNAGSLSISGNNKVYVGSSIKISVSFKNIAGKFSVSSSNNSVLAGGDTQFYDNETASFTFQAKSAGTATITVSPIGKVGDYDNDEGYTGGSRSITISVLNKQNKPSIDVNKTYSKNNFLKSLSIDDYDLTPSFDKNILEYSVELIPGSELININASLEDSKANVKGIGEINVSDGINTIEIVVTAENGNERVYKITANMEEKDPINVKINKKNYTVVKRSELLGEKSGYELTTVKINDYDVPSFYNAVTNVYLVGLKDKEGNIKFFNYNSKTGEYSSYNECTFDQVNLFVFENKKSKYEKVDLNINNDQVVGYKVPSLNEYYLLYATNTTTGYTGYYLYDIKENTVQRYNTYILEKITKEKDKYLSIVTVLSCVCFLTMLFLLIEINKKKDED